MLNQVKLGNNSAKALRRPFLLKKRGSIWQSRKMTNPIVQLELLNYTGRFDYDTVYRR